MEANYRASCPTLLKLNGACARGSDAFKELLESRRLHGEAYDLSQDDKSLLSQTLVRHACPDECAILAARLRMHGHERSGPVWEDLRISTEAGWGLRARPVHGREGFASGDLRAPGVRPMPFGLGDHLLTALRRSKHHHGRYGSHDGGDDRTCRAQAAGDSPPEAQDP